jgi:hypothetical protein
MFRRLCLAEPTRLSSNLLGLLHLLRSGIGTVLTKWDLALCPQLARADVSPPDGNSGYDPNRKWGDPIYCDAQYGRDRYDPFC